MKKHPLLVISIAFITASYLSTAHAQMRSRSQGTGAPVITEGRSTPANLNGASQAPLTFDLSGIAFSGNSPVPLPLPGGGSGAGGVTYSSSTPSICTVNGNSLIPVAPGSCTIVASKGASGVYGSTSVSATKVIPLINQSPLSFSIPTLSFSNGTATLPAPTGGSGSGGLTYVSDTPSICSVSGTSVTALGIGTCAITATKAGSEAMGPISARAEFAIAAQPQASLNFSISSLTFGSDGTAILPAASGGSGAGSITYAASGSCSLSGTTLTANSIGTCSVTATKAANGIYAPVTATSTLNVAAQAQSNLTFDISSLSFGSGVTVTIPAAGGGSGGGALSYTASGACTLSGTTLTATSPGNCTVTAVKAANGIYSQATKASTLSIASRTQSPLSFNLASVAFNRGTATIPVATGGSGSGAISYTATGSCTLSGNTLTTTGIGTCSVTAAKAASGLFSSVTAASTVNTPAVPPAPGCYGPANNGGNSADGVAACSSRGLQFDTSKYQQQCGSSDTCTTTSTTGATGTWSCKSQNMYGDNNWHPGGVFPVIGPSIRYWCN
jgi:trimeric autotransporter adhesin